MTPAPPQCPTDDMFKDYLDLHKFAEAALPDRALEVADPAIWIHEEAKGKDPARVRSGSEVCLASVIGLGVSCSKQLPSERTAMRDAAAEMRAIRDACLVQCATDLACSRHHRPWKRRQLTGEWWTRDGGPVLSS
jgi:hypothetical protein